MIAILRILKKFKHSLIIVSIMFLSLCLILNMRAANRYGYHPDEGLWIASGYHYFEKFFLKKHWRQRSWDRNDFAAFGRSNPVIGKYLIGATLYIADVMNEKELTKVRNIRDVRGRDWWSKVSRIRFKMFVVAKARIPSMVAGCLCAALIYLLIYELFQSIFAGVMSALFFITRPLVLERSTWVMMDMMMLAGCLAVLYCTALLVRKIDRQASLLALILPTLGLSLGMLLGMGTKLSAATAILVGVLWVLVYAFFAAKNRWSFLLRGFLAYLVAGAISLSLFVGLSPYLYGNVFKGIERMYALGKQIRNYPVPPEQRLDTSEDRLSFLVEDGIMEQGSFAYWLDLGEIDLLLILVGMLSCFYFLRRAFHEDGVRRGLFPLLWFAVVLTYYLLLVPFSWPRWTFPTIPTWAVFETIGMLTFFSLGQSFFFKKKE